MLGLLLLRRLLLWQQLALQLGLSLWPARRLGLWQQRRLGLWRRLELQHGLWLQQQFWLCLWSTIQL